VEKIIGAHVKLDAAQSLHKMHELNYFMNKLRPYKKPVGKILKFKTYQALLEFTIMRSANKT